MKRIQKLAILLSLIEKLKKNGCWCSETHIQKATYHLQNAENVDLEYDFILYKHGPFSFDLRDELTAMRADGLIDLYVNPLPYSPSYVLTDYGHDIIEHFPKTLGQYRDSVEKTARFIGDKGVAELERLTTALFVTKKEEEKSVSKRAIRIHELKPHVSIDEAEKAIKQIDAILTKEEIIR